MPQARNDSGPVGAIDGGRSASWVLIGLLVSIVCVGAAFYIYEQAHFALKKQRAAVAIVNGDPRKGPGLIQHYGCGGCHSIPGVPGASGQVGPDLSGIGQRVYVAGVISNTPDHLISFIVDPQAIDPKSAMPKTGITAEEAADVAAYLYSAGS
jgi:cytochrome c